MSFKIGSLFDGSGGFPLAASMCGGIPTWAAEIEPYPVAVTKSRFPGMKHLGSVTDINGGTVEPVDIITFGSPCQDLSVAGKRAGLKHEANGDEETTRSGLFMEAVRIIKEMREATNGRYPAFALWENVPGAFSSNKGEDFRIVLQELIQIVEPTAVMPEVPKNGWAYADVYCGNGWSLAYRVFDAQYWGVPQRRRRIYALLDLRGERAGKILFESEGLRGYLAEGRTPWQGSAADAERGPGAADRAYSLNTTTSTAVPIGFDTYNMIPTGDKTVTLRAGSEYNYAPVFQPVTLEPGIAAREGGHVYEGVSGTLRANMGDNQMSIAYSEMVLDDQGGSQISVRTDGKSPTLRAEMHGNVPCVMESAGFCPEQSAKTRGIGFENEEAPTLRAGVTPAVVYSIENHPADSRVNIDESGKVQTLTSRMGTGGGNVPMVLEQKPVLCMATQQGGAEIMEDKCPTITAAAGMSGNNQPVACYSIQGNTIDRDAKQNGSGVSEDVSHTLNSVDRHGWDGSQTTGTLTANNAGGNQRMPDKENFNCVIEKKAGRYIVRRLTPTECARLQGFPDKWGHPDKKDDFTEEEYRFWLDVRNLHAAINDKAVKEYTKEQMLTWYNKLHTDSSEYKMWGNGIALPCALYVMQGVGEALK